MKMHVPWRKNELAVTPEYARGELPVEYGVQYPWGNLIVSRAAHEAYGLPPQVEVSNELSSSTGEKLDVWLIAPQEIDPSLSTFESLQSYAPQDIEEISEELGVPLEMRFSSNATSANGHSQIFVGLDRTTSATVQDILDSIRANSAAGNERAQYLEAMLDADEVRQKVHDQLAHLIPSIIASSLEDLANAEIVQKGDERLVRNITRLGCVGLAGAGALGGVSFLEEGRISPTIEILQGLYTASYLMLIRLRVKRDLKANEAARESSRNAALASGQAVGEDIHMAFCPHAHQDSDED